MIFKASELRYFKVSFSWIYSLLCHQLLLAEEDPRQDLLCHICWFLPHNMVPFGLKNAPMTTACLMDRFRAWLGDCSVFMYLNDATVLVMLAAVAIGNGRSMYYLFIVVKQCYSITLRVGVHIKKKFSMRFNNSRSKKQLWIYTFFRIKQLIGNQFSISIQFGTTLPIIGSLIIINTSLLC